MRTVMIDPNSRLFQPVECRDTSNNPLEVGNISERMPAVPSDTEINSFELKKMKI